MSYPNQYREFKKICDELYKLHVRKNNDYGPNNILDLGERGVFVRLWDKINRLKQLVWEQRTAQVKDESIDDTLRDTAIYSIIGLILRRGKWGK